MKSSLVHSIYIRPDMTREARISLSILMKERWKLIKSGGDRKDIKVRGSRIYLNMQLHGKLDTENRYIHAEQDCLQSLKLITSQN